MIITYLQFSLRHINFSTIDKLYNELQIAEAYILRHNYCWMFTWIFQKQLLKVWWARRQYNLQRQKNRNTIWFFHTEKLQRVRPRKQVLWMVRMMEFDVSHIVPANVILFNFHPYFMETKGSFLHSQEHVTCPNLEPDQSSPCPPSPSWRSILILSSHLCLGL